MLTRECMGGLSVLLQCSPQCIHVYTFIYKAYQPNKIWLKAMPKPSNSINYYALNIIWKDIMLGIHVCTYIK